MGVGQGPRRPDGGVRPETGEIELAPIWPGDEGGAVVAHFSPDALRTTRRKLQAVADEATSGQGNGTPSAMDATLSAAANGYPGGSPLGQPTHSPVFRNTANCHEEAVHEFGARYTLLLAALGQIAAGMSGTANNLDESEDATQVSALHVQQMMDGGAPTPAPAAGGVPAGGGTRPSPPGQQSGSVDDVGPGGSFDSGGA